MRLIDGDALRDKSFMTGEHPTVNNPYRDLDEVVSVDDIDNAPTIDVAPVKHGHWVYNQNGHDWGLGAWECSLCHSVNNNLPIDKRFSPYVYAGSKYCPNCGAKMDGGDT